MEITHKKGAARFRWKRLLLWVRIREKIAGLRPFLLSFGITMAVFALLAGWSVAGFRCRMTIDPPAAESIVCDLRQDYIRLRVLDWEFSMKIEVIPPRLPQRLKAPSR